MEQKTELRGVDTKLIQLDDPGFLPPDTLTLTDVRPLEPGEAMPLLDGALADAAVQAMRDEDQAERKRGENPHLVTFDESGFLDKNGKIIYVASFNGQSRQLVDAEGNALDPASISFANMLHGEVVAPALAEKPKSSQDAALEDSLRNAFKPENNRNNDPRVIAHKKDVVGRRWKLLRQQKKQEKFKKLQAKAVQRGE